MSDKSPIEWTDATWNPITGCSVVSAGCKHCYAMKLAGTRLRHHPSRVGLTQDTSAGPVWTGEVRFNEEWLRQPLQWKRPRRVFVCAHGDLFHEAVPDEWIDRVFAVMALAKQHTFQVLTKRPARAREYLRRLGKSAKVLDAAARSIGYTFEFAGQYLVTWPLPNVWLGVSVEDQAAADERIPLLLDTPAAVRWISAEPLLGSVRLCRCDGASFGAQQHPFLTHTSCPLHGNSHIHWVVVGGESGLNARPMSPDWVRSLRDQCEVARVHFLFKQWGEWLPMLGQAEGVPVGAKTTTGDGWVMGRAGKKAAGRSLDGVLHDEYPEGSHD